MTKTMTKTMTMTMTMTMTKTKTMTITITKKKDFVPLCLCVQLINPCFRAAPYQGAQNVQKMPLMPP